MFEHTPSGRVRPRFYAVVLTLLALCALTTLGACRTDAAQGDAAQDDAALGSAAVGTTSSTRPYLTLHLANLASEEAEQDMLAILDTFNQVIADLGQPDVRYSLWQVEGQHEDFYDYIYYALWPDSATYRAVQRQPEYALLNRMAGLFRQTVEAERFHPFELNDATVPLESIQRTPASDSPRSLVLYQLYSYPDETEHEAHEETLREMLLDFDRAAAELGYPETGYTLWNSLSPREELPGHLVLGFWPSPEAYAEAQDDRLYVDAADTYRLGYEEMFAQKLSNQYIEVLPE